jgi:hypothetical protein
MKRFCLIIQSEINEDVSLTKYVKLMIIKSEYYDNMIVDQFCIENHDFHIENWHLIGKLR